MDVSFSQEAVQSMMAHFCGAGRKTMSGFLFGHKRGQRFYVEKAYPSSGVAFSVPERCRALDRLSEGKMIGFYSSSSSSKSLAGFLQPAFFGKLVLRAEVGSGARLSLKPHVVEFDKSFYFLPISLCSRPKGKK
jgi:hypothetical protein